jgi:hypothetical protein
MIVATANVRDGFTAEITLNGETFRIDSSGERVPEEIE